MMLKRGGPGETDNSLVLLKTLFFIGIITLFFFLLIYRERPLSIDL